MNFRYEKRMVPTEQSVAVVECDNCGKSGEFPENAYGRHCPADWFTVGSGAEVLGVFCSKACVAQWASTASPTSADLTNIARESFAKATQAH